ncbi:MAG: LamG domain-containing protein [Kiritimatiellae bacterium]|nr:LamG domain-containing protein [Kiritimatiellia bacterium]
MKLDTSLVVFALSIAAFAGEAPRTTLATASLKDGSTLKGEFLTKQITGSTAFMEKLALEPTIIKSLVFTGTNGESKVSLCNGDSFAMKISNNIFKLKSLIGNLEIPRTSFRSLTFSPQRGTSAAKAGLVFFCTFDDEKSVASPMAGPSVKLELGTIRGNGKNGGALYVEPGVAGAQIAFPAGTFGNEGCIEFWANIASGKTEFSTGGDPRFFLLSGSAGREFAHLEFASNNGAGGSGLSGHICGLRAQTNHGCSYMMPYSDVFKGENYNGWHHYAFVWSVGSLKIFIDGKLVCSGSGQCDTAALSNSTVLMDIPLNRIRGKSFNNKSAFYMDDLKIWNFAKTDFEL